MTADKFNATLEEWQGRVKSRYERATIEVSNATEIIGNSRITVAHISEEPGKCIGYFESRKNGDQFEVVKSAVFDKPRALEEMPKTVIATVLSVRDCCPVGILRRTTRQTHGLN